MDGWVMPVNAQSPASPPASFTLIWLLSRSAATCNCAPERGWAPPDAKEQSKSTEGAEQPQQTYGQELSPLSPNPAAVKFTNLLFC